MVSHVDLIEHCSELLTVEYLCSIHKCQMHSQGRKVALLFSAELVAVLVVTIKYGLDDMFKRSHMEHGMLLVRNSHHLAIMTGRHGKNDELRLDTPEYVHRNMDKVVVTFGASCQCVDSTAVWCHHRRQT